MNYTFDEVMGLDQALHQLATYEVTRGLIVIPKTPEDYIELLEKIAEKFNYFKMLIKNNECTLQYINKRVLEKNGPFPRTKFNINDIDKMDFKQIEETNNKEDTIHNFAEQLLKAFLPGICNNSIVNTSNTPKSMNKIDPIEKTGVKITIKSLDCDIPSPPNLTDKKTKKPIAKKIIRKKIDPKKD